MKSKWSILYGALLACSLALTGCGGGGGGGDDDDAGGITGSLTATNYAEVADDVVVSVIGRSQQFSAVPFGVQGSQGPGAGPVDVTRRIVEEAIQAMRSKGRVQAFAISESTGACDESGTWKEVTYEQSADDVTPGDYYEFRYDDCSYAVGHLLKGRVKVTLDSFKETGDSIEYEATTVYEGFSLTMNTIELTLDGTVKTKNWWTTDESGMVVRFNVDVTDDGKRFRWKHELSFRSSAEDGEISLGGTAVVDGASYGLRQHEPFTPEGAGAVDVVDRSGHYVRITLSDADRKIVYEFFQAGNDTPVGTTTRDADDLFAPAYL
jgi:hypothetical protein